MGLRTNIVATYVSQLYAALLGLVMAPVYLKLLGYESYGLIGLFVMLQGWFQLLDLGLTPAWAREVARQRTTATDLYEFRRLLRAIESLFLVIGLLAALVMLISAEWLAESWLQSERLPRHTVVAALQLIGLTVVLRWIAELYRSSINGYERLVWLAGFNAGIASTRYLLVLPALLLTRGGVVLFFAFQLFIALAETAMLVRKAYQLLPRLNTRVAWSLRPLQRILPLSLTLFFLSIVWVAISQTDKLILSGVLSLADYATYTLAVSATSGVLLLSTPLAAVLMPKLTSLATRGEEGAMVALYRDATQWLGILAWPCAALLAVHAERVMWIWTGDRVLASQASATLALYACGNAFMAVGALPFYLQFAKGRLHLHLVGTLLFLLPLIPGLLWAAPRFGAPGAGWVWFSMNAVYFFLWVPLAHWKFAPQGMHLSWLTRDVLPIAIWAFLAAILTLCLPWPVDRLIAGGQFVAVAAGSILIGALGSSTARRSARALQVQLMQRRYKKFSKSQP